MADSNEPPAPEQGFAARLLREVPGLTEAVAVAKRLNQLLRRDSDESLDQVLDAAARTSLIAAWSTAANGMASSTCWRMPSRRKGLIWIATSAEASSGETITGAIQSGRTGCARVDAADQQRARQEHQRCAEHRRALAKQKPPFLRRVRVCR